MEVLEARVHMALSMRRYLVAADCHVGGGEGQRSVLSN
jgi:hypothetical protein